MNEPVLTVGSIAQAIGAEVEGDSSLRITGVAALDTAGASEITFVFDARRARRLGKSKAGAAIVGPDVTGPAGMTLLRSADPEQALAKLLATLAAPEDLPPVGVHPSAEVSPSARLGCDVRIGPHAVVGANAAIADGAVLSASVSVGADVRIGEQTILFPSVVVYPRCVIGRRCRIHANAVIGSDGFGYYHRQGVQHKIPHAGTVIIGDDVEIGACTCIDRAKFGATRIADGAKIDNLVQIAHNVRIGRGAVITAQVGIAGSAEIGDYVVLGGNAGIADNVKLGAGSRVAGMSGVLADLEPGIDVMGIPAFPLRDFMKSTALFRRLPELKDLINQLQARMDALERATTNDRP